MGRRRKQPYNGNKGKQQDAKKNPQITAPPSSSEKNSQNPARSSSSGSRRDNILENGATSSSFKDQEKEPLKEKIRKNYCKDYSMKEGLYIGKVNMNSDHKDEQHKVQKLSLGKPNTNVTKVILLVGATGTGKTTLINAMMNYMFSVEFEDNFRFIIVDEKDDPLREESKSQTDYITAFAFNQLPGMPFDYNYVLIDTPGFGDTRGIERDREMMSQIESFFNQDYGIDQLDAVGFVIPASVTRLTQTQKYVFDSLSSIFGHDVRDNIFIMATFADARKPPVLKALKDSEMQYGEVFKFNNSALYANIELQDQQCSDDSDSEDESSLLMSKQYWEMAIKSMDKFFKNLGEVTPVSLKLTKEVLEERRHLQTVLCSLQAQVQLGLDKLTILNQERQLLSQINDDLKGCANHHITVQVPKMEEIHLKPNECTTNCLRCNFTCHFPCHLPQIQDKQHCAAMKGGTCKVCPLNCGWEFHKHMNFRYETSWHKEKRTAQELLSRYNKACKGKISKVKVIHEIEEDINKHSQNLIEMIKKIHTHVKRLEEIALKPNPLSTKGYIDLMVQSEKMQKKTNFKSRISMLLKLKEEVQILEAANHVEDILPSSGEALLCHFQKMMTDNNKSSDDESFPN